MNCAAARHIDWDRVILWRNIPHCIWMGSGMCSRTDGGQGRCANIRRETNSLILIRWLFVSCAPLRFVHWRIALEIGMRFYLWNLWQYPLCGYDFISTYNIHAWEMEAFSNKYQIPNSPSNGMYFILSFSSLSSSFSLLEVEKRERTKHNCLSESVHSTEFKYNIITI